MATKVFIDGEHGTTGLQIRTRLAARADIDVLSVPQTQRRDADLRRERLNEADIAILCLPDDAARESVSMLEGNNSTRVIDTSTANRVNPDWTYGFAEMEPDQRQRIAGARLLANPGCYPTGAIGLIRPLTRAGILPRDYPVTINAVSGYSGGGKQMIAQMEDEGHDDHIGSPYFLYGLTLAHKHLPEIRQHALLTRTPVFSPSVGRFAQGMIVQVPLHLADLNDAPSPGDIQAALEAHYAGQSAVTLIGEEQTRTISRVDPTELNDSDNMRLLVFANEPAGLVNLVAVLDNLGKGASGAAVQNMDIMLGNIVA